jgi:hypothetical protein
MSINHESESLGLLRLNMALLPEYKACSFVVYKHGTPNGVQTLFFPLPS